MATKQPIIQPIYDQYGNIIDYQEYRDPGLLPDGTYDRPTNPSYGQPGGYNDPYLGAPPNSGWDQSSGTWHPDYPSPASGAPPSPGITPPTTTTGPAPNPTTAPKTTATGAPGGMSSLAAPPNNESFNWPSFNAPTMTAPQPFSYGDFNYDSYAAPDKFSYQDFQAPSADQARQDPGYEFARTEGLRALTNRASATGSANTGGTMKDLISWGDQFANQNYGNVFNRGLQSYQANRGNAFDSWGANELARAKTYDTNRTNAFDNYTSNRNNAAANYSTNYGVARDTFDRQYQGALDTFKPQQDAAQRTFNDLYARWRDQLNATTNIATAGAV